MEWPDLSKMTEDQAIEWAREQIKNIQSSGAELGAIISKASDIEYEAVRTSIAKLEKSYRELIKIYQCYISDLEAVKRARILLIGDLPELPGAA